MMEEASTIFWPSLLFWKKFPCNKKKETKLHCNFWSEQKKEQNFTHHVRKQKVTSKNGRMLCIFPWRSPSTCPKTTPTTDQNKFTQASFSPRTKETIHSENKCFPIILLMKLRLPKAKKKRTKPAIKLFYFVSALLFYERTVFL